MGKIAFLFAGQGAQSPGMGRSLAELGGEAARVFEAAESVRPGLTKMCFEGTKEDLAQTINTQPAVFTVDLAAAMALAERGIEPDGVAGFSLGEMAALTFACAFTMEQGFSLVCRRAEWMQLANERNPGGMAAVMRLDDAQVEQLCRNFHEIYPVNYNSDGQLVVAGSTEELPAFCAAVKMAGGVAKPLAVSGGFHSPYMFEAAESMRVLLEQQDISQPDIPVYANLTARPYGDEPAQTLADQMQNPVLWKQCIRQMAQDGFDTFIEVGPGKTLTGLVKRILPDALALSVQSAEDLALVAEQVSARVSA